MKRNYPLLLASQYLSAFGDNVILSVIIGQLTLLQQRGLIRRERSESDRRSHNIVLTDEGLRVARAGADAAEPMERELDERLSRAERLMLIELLRKVAGR